MIKTAEPPHGPARITAALATAAAGLGAGVAFVLLGVVATGACSAEGFACLGWLFAGAFAACAAAAIVMVLVGRRLGLGWGFGLVTSGITALALLPLEGWVRALLVAIAPVTATVLTWPKGAKVDDDGDGPAPRRRRVIFGGGLALVGLLIAVIGWSVVQQERTLLDFRKSEYESTRLPMIGLPDDAGWRYESVQALGGTKEERPDLIGYYLTDETGIRIRVETRLAQDSGAQPPDDCSTDPYRVVPCSETVPGVYVANPETNQRFVVFGSAITTVAVYDGTVSDADLDALCASLEVRDARWLAARESWLYRVLD